MKLCKAIATIALLIHGATQAVVHEYSQDQLKIRGTIQDTFLAKPADANIWFFEFKNKTKEPLFLTIVCEGSSNYSIMDEFKVAASTGSSEKNHGYLRLAKTVFKILTDERPGEGICYLLIRNEKNTFEKAWKLSSVGNKTQFNWEEGRIYLTYEKGALRIQEGSRGKTQSGLALKGFIMPTIASIKPDLVLKKLMDIEKMR